MHHNDNNNIRFIERIIFDGVPRSFQTFNVNHAKKQTRDTHKIIITNTYTYFVAKNLLKDHKVPIIFPYLCYKWNADVVEIVCNVRSSKFFLVLVGSPAMKFIIVYICIPYRKLEFFAQKTVLLVLLPMPFFHLCSAIEQKTFTPLTSIFPSIHSNAFSFIC